MSIRADGISILQIPLIPLKAVVSFNVGTDVKVEKSYLIRDLQFRKAFFPILVTLFGMVIDVRELQALKTLISRLVTPFGMVIDFIE